MSDNHKIIILTGASRGIGRATALKLSQNKSNHIVLVARSVNQLKELKTIIDDAGGHAYVQPCDVTLQEDVKRVVTWTLQKFGTIDTLINNAGIGSYKRIDKFSIDEIRRMYDVNVFGYFLFTKYVIPELIEKKQGQIINVASIAGLNGFQGGTAYAGTKFAVVGFSESLREDLKHYGIAVSIVCPGSVNTGFGGSEYQENPDKPFTMEPTDVAKAINYLVEESETVNTKLMEIKPRKRQKFR